MTFIMIQDFIYSTGSKDQLQTEAKKSVTADSDITYLQAHGAWHQAEANQAGSHTKPGTSLLSFI